MSNDEKMDSYLNQSSETFACFNRSARSEIQYSGKKVVGSAQKLFKGAILQHGSIMLGREHEQIVDFLKTDDWKKREQMEILQTKSISLNQISKRTVSTLKLIDELITVFEKVSNVRFYYKYPTVDEIKQAMQFKDLVVI